MAIDKQGLIGKEMFSIDGCKLPSNASKEWSGTKADFKKKAAKMEKAISNILKKHKEHDQSQDDKEIIAREASYSQMLCMTSCSLLLLKRSFVNAIINRIPAQCLLDDEIHESCANFFLHIAPDGTQWPK